MPCMLECSSTKYTVNPWHGFSTPLSSHTRSLAEQNNLTQLHEDFLGLGRPMHPSHVVSITETKNQSPHMDSNRFSTSHHTQYNWLSNSKKVENLRSWWLLEIQGKKIDDSDMEFGSKPTVQNFHGEFGVQKGQLHLNAGVSLGNKTYLKIHDGGKLILNIYEYFPT